mmetsp:Transcript_11508/g.30084  ORF Transcript_11508/g.30084 Transcript_11508/m.30084 type:complete len:232 (-) Transcript_11508:109-804(-)
MQVGPARLLAGLVCLPGLVMRMSATSIASWALPTTKAAVLPPQEHLHSLQGHPAAKTLRVLAPLHPLLLHPTQWHLEKQLPQPLPFPPFPVDCFAPPHQLHSQAPTPTPHTPHTPHAPPPAHPCPVQCKRLLQQTRTHLRSNKLLLLSARMLFLERNRQHRMLLPLRLMQLQQHQQEHQLHQKQVPRHRRLKQGHGEPAQVRMPPLLRCLISMQSSGRTPMGPNRQRTPHQ